MARSTSPPIFRYFPNMQSKLLLKSTALHESGHVVIALMARIPFCSVNIKRRHSFPYAGTIFFKERWYESRGYLNSLVYFNLAGRASTSLFLSHLVVVGDSREDLREAAIILMDMYSESNYYQRMTGHDRDAFLKVQLLMRYNATKKIMARKPVERAVKLIAEKLLSERSLNAPQIKALLREDLGIPRPILKWSDVKARRYAEHT